MPDPNETGQKGGRSVKEEAVAQVREEIKKAEESANPEKEKRELGERLAKELKNVIEDAKEVVANEEKAKRGEEVFTKKEEKKDVTIKVIKALEAAKRGIPVTEKKESQVFLQKIAEEIPSPSPSQCNQLAAYLTPYLLGDEDIIINPPGQPKSKFQEDFEALAKINPRLAEDIKEALKKTAREGNISIPEDLIDQLKIPSETDEEIDQIGKTRRRRMLTEEEKKEYIEIWRNILEKYSERTTSGLKKEGDDEKMTRISLVFLPIEDTSLLKDMGFSDDQIKKFLELRDRFNQDLDTRFLGQYTPILEPAIEQAKRDFADIESFFSFDSQGRITMSKEQKQAFEDLIRKYFYQGLSIIHQNTSQEFHSVLKDRMELNYYFSLIGQIVTYTCDRLKERLPDDKNYEELRLFFEDKSESFMSRIMNNAQLFHNLPLYTRNLGSVEEIKKLFSFIYPTQLAEVFDDKTNLMAIARDELTMFLREYLIINNNEYKGDLLSGRYQEEGARWSEWFKEEYKKRLKEKLKRLKLYQGEEDEWKLDMLRTYAEGIGIATLIDGEILATSDPVSHFREVHPLMSLLSAKHNWKGGRGRDAPGLINRFLLGMDIDLFPQERSLLTRLTGKKKFVPEKFYKMVSDRARDYGGIIIDEMTEGKANAALFGMGGLYQELISMFSIPGDIVSWGGWRVQGISEELGKLSKLIYGFDKPKDFNQWQDFFDLSLELYGTTSLWWQIGVFGGSRPVSEVEKIIEKKIGKDAIKKLSAERPNDRVIEINGRKMSYLELRMWRMNQLRGELFFRYLRRNPGDFLQILVQLCPEILEKKSEVFKDEKEDDSENIKRKRNALKKRWGKEGFTLLKNINKWLDEESQKIEDPETGEKFKDIKKFIIYFRERSSEAFERMKIRNEEARRKIIEIINNENIEGEKKKELISKERRKILYLSQEDFNGDEEVWELFAGGEGSFFEKITGLSYDKADEYFAKFGSYDQLGEINIFFIIANNWVLRNGDISPFTADIAYYDIYRHLHYSGESTFSRLWDANITNFKEVLSQIPNLEKLLLHAAENSSLEEIYKLHQKVFDTLSGLVGPEYAYRANYILAQIVSQFFMEHSILRDPKFKWLGPVGWIIRPLLGKNVSLSKILTHNRHAFSMDNNALRSYFMTLSHHMHVLPVEGIFSKEQLEKVFEVTTGEFIVGDVFPSLLWFIFLFILFTYIKKAIEEAEGKKK